MKEFFKMMFASCLGSAVALGAITFFTFMIIIAMISAIGTEEAVRVADNSILMIDLDYPVPERSYTGPVSGSVLGIPRFTDRIGLNDIVKSIRNAKEDSRIQGMFISLNNFGMSSYASIDAIRDEIISFRESGKFVTAHGDRISQRAYYLATAADNIYMTPTGSLDFRGLAIEITFYKKTLEKLDIEAQIFRAGEFKSAVEPYEFEKMSRQNREQLFSFITHVNNSILSNIANERNMSIDSVHNISNKMLVRSPQDAEYFGLVDSLMYRADLQDYFRKLLYMTEDAGIKAISIKDYARSGYSTQTEFTRDRIAVIYALGIIHEGDGNIESIGMKNIIDAIRTAKKNSRVKAIVLRVNSPGGSPLTSDIILNEIKETKKEKPIVVSMGNVAASGGYYIACEGEVIVAEPNSLTGSIGVYGIIPNMKDFFDNKLGVTFDRIKTGKHSDIYTIYKPLTAEQRRIIQDQIDSVYSTFVSRVAEGRGMSETEVNEIARGRIWSGTEAVEIGLVDTLGSLDDAINIAADLAGTHNYKVLEYPRMPEPFERVMDFLYEDSTIKLLKEKLGENYKIYQQLEYLMNERGIQARMPFDVEVY
jgi:protease-4